MQKLFGVYITMYTGKLLPKWYIGSSSIEKIENGYNGSVKSKKWKDIYKLEQKENKHLFKTRVISYHSTRKEALTEELRIQRLHNNVVINVKYYNESYACKNGFFGMIASEESKKENVKKRKNNEHNCYHNNNNLFKDQSVIANIKKIRKNKCDSILVFKTSHQNQYTIHYNNCELNVDEFCVITNTSVSNFRNFLLLNKMYHINQNIIENFLFLKNLEPTDKKFLYRNIISKDNIKYRLYYKIETPDGFTLEYLYSHLNRLKGLKCQEQ